MSCSSVHSIKQIDSEWDQIAANLYQKRNFLLHLEKTNPLRQRYYLMHEKNQLKAGAVVYSLAVNFFTFSRMNLKLPMQIIGLPLSCDASGLLGEDCDISILVDFILEKEKGIVLGLNHAQHIKDERLISLRNLPSMIFRIEHPDWESYLNAVKHNYRRRIISAKKRGRDLRQISSSCQNFSQDHYQQYLAVIHRSKTTLEVLPLAFFTNLPDTFQLNSYYYEKTLVYWNISFLESGTYNFLLGGMDYSKRDLFDSYYNNLISIMQDGFEYNCIAINFGQTAEISKARLGAIPEEKSMFLYHKNRLVRGIFRLLKHQLTNSNESVSHQIYKRKSSVKEVEIKQYDYAEF